MWQKLSEAVEAVHSERPISYSLEELYQAVENMCSHKMATKLYDKLRTACQRHAQSLVPTYDLYPPSPAAAAVLHTYCMV